MEKGFNSQAEQSKQNTLKIWDGAEDSCEEKKETGGWGGFHVLFTEKTQFLIIWESIRKKLITAFLGVLAFIALFIVCLGGDILFLPKAVLISAVVAAFYGLCCRDDVYTKVFDPSRDQGRLYLPEEMTWEAAVDAIRRGFAEVAVDQITDTADTVAFHSKKYGVYQIQNTENGLMLSILSTPSKKDEKIPRYFLFGNMIYSQVIALLYPQLISATQVEQEKKAVHRYVKQKKMTKLLGVVVFVIVAVAAATWYFNMDSVKSCGISDSKIDVFSADATINEIFGAYFDDSEWDHYEQDGQTIVTYSGDKVLSDEKITRFTFYFLLNTDDTFILDRVTSNGSELDWLQSALVLNMLDENYTGMGTTASAEATIREDEGIGDYIPDDNDPNVYYEGEYESTNNSEEPVDAEWYLVYATENGYGDDYSYSWRCGFGIGYADAESGIAYYNSFLDRIVSDYIIIEDEFSSGYDVGFQTACEKLYN